MADQVQAANIGFSAAKIAGGSLDTLGVYEAIGIVVMFAGFLSIGRFR